MSKLLRFFLFFSLLSSILMSSTAVSYTPSIHLLRVEGPIVPVVADYINRGITQAEAQGAEICIIQLNTPGGLYESTQKIVSRILNAKVPIGVYVSPAGGWAGSAGTFITIASHLAIMAPGSRLGAASPVAIGTEMPEVQAKKITEDAAAWIRSIAQMRGRDPYHAELAVREGRSYSDTEALEHNLIDLRADSLDNLLLQLEGRKVKLASGEERILKTKNYALRENQMGKIEQFLHAISNPNIAYILLSLATIGIIAELYNPGLIFPGVFGGISLLLAFYSLGVLSAYWGGLLLILLAFIFFIAEFFVTGHGLLAGSGMASLILGSLILFSGTPFEVNRGLIAGVALTIAAFLALALTAVIRAQRRQATTGAEGLVQKVAVAQTALNPMGVVLVEGERWSAIIDSGKAEPGEEVIITKVKGLQLLVTKKLEKEAKNDI